MCNETKAVTSLARLLELSVECAWSKLYICSSLEQTIEQDLSEQIVRSVGDQANSQVGSTSLVENPLTNCNGYMSG